MSRPLDANFLLNISDQVSRRSYSRDDNEEARHERELYRAFDKALDEEIADLERHIKNG